MQLSIIIPTYNRLETLKRCLSAIDVQEEVDLGNDVEVLVVDDGSADGTYEWLTENVGAFRFLLRPYVQENAGQGNARNLGLGEMKGNLAMFIGDDIFLHPRALSRHLAVHAESPAEEFACLGFTTWHPELRITNFMYFLEHGGHQFQYGAITKPFGVDEKSSQPPLRKGALYEADYWFFYTSNISLKRSLIGDFRFERVYTSYGWEDIDFGYRLTKERGLRIIYNPRAKAWHHHEVTIAGFRERMRSIAKNARTFHQRFPEVPVLPNAFKKIVFWLLSLLPFLLLLKGLGAISSRAERFYFYALSKKYWLEGLR